MSWIQYFLFKNKINTHLECLCIDIITENDKDNNKHI